MAVGLGLFHLGAMNYEPILQIDLPGIPKVKSGKVREMFDLGDRLLLVATDRISAFDCIMPNGIPRKGRGADPDLPFLVRQVRRASSPITSWRAPTILCPPACSPLPPRWPAGA